MADRASQSPKDLERSLTLRFGAPLALLVALLGVTYLVVSIRVSAKEHDSVIVNLAGRQRMLIQKYAREVSQPLVALATSDTELIAAMTEVSSRTADLYETAHGVLLEGGEVEAGEEERIQIPSVQGADVIEQLRKVEIEWGGLRRAAALAIHSDTGEWNQHLGDIGKQTAKAVAEMDRAVLLIQRRSEAKLRRVEVYMAWAGVLGALLLLGTVLFVRRKIVVPLAETMTALSLTNDGLEGEIIQREAVEAALREREAMISLVLETAADGIITIDESGTIESANGSACRIFGYTSAELIGNNVEILMPAAFRDKQEGYLERYLRIGERNLIGNARELVGLRKDGSVFPMELAVGESKLSGRMIFSGIVRDLEQERGKDERLGRLLNLFEDAADPMVIRDIEGRIIDVNDEAVRVYGFSREELLGKSIKVLVPPERHAEADELLKRCRAGEKVRGIEFVRRTKSGKIVPVLLSVSLLTDEQGQAIGLASHAKDISALKQLQAQLLQAQKLEAIGILVGGIAHDFNNLLTSIRGSSEILIDQLEPGGRLARSARRIEKAADRATALTTRMLGFSRKQVTQRVPLDMNEAVEEIRELFVRTLAEDVEFKTELSSEVLHVFADESQLGQVLMNLVVNAGDAMPTGGNLLLTTAREEVFGDRARLLDVSPGRYVVLIVRDSGQGIPPEAMAKIFDPFFTTKDVGKGTGLGLSTAIGIIREHGGAITVESEVGIGTVFTVLLPEIDAPLIEAETADPAVARTQASGETLLLVEDDEIARDLLNEILEEEGYVVLEAAEPVEALARAHAHDGGVALVVTDVVMPHMSGFLLAKELRSQYPQIRVLYMSGYTDQVLADRGDLRGDDPFIRKPFGNDSFLKKVREVLDAKPHGFS